MKKSYYLESPARLRNYINTEKFKKDSADPLFQYAAKIISENKNPDSAAYKFSRELLSLHSQLGRVDKQGHSIDNPQTVSRYLDLYLGMQKIDGVAERGRLNQYVAAKQFKQAAQDPVLKQAADILADPQSPQYELATRLISYHAQVGAPGKQDKNPLLAFKYQYLYDQLNSALQEKNRQTLESNQVVTKPKSSLRDRLGLRREAKEAQSSVDNTQKPLLGSARKGLTPQKRESIQEGGPANKRRSITWTEASTHKKPEIQSETQTAKDAYTDFEELVSDKIKAIQAKDFLGNLGKSPADNIKGLPERLREARSAQPNYEKRLAEFVDKHQQFLEKSGGVDRLINTKIQRLGGEKLLQRMGVPELAVLKGMKDELQNKVLVRPESKGK